MFVITPECVEIHNLILMEESGKKLVSYFLENSFVLKKLIPRFRDSLIYLTQISSRSFLNSESGLAVVRLFFFEKLAIRVHYLF